MIQALLSAEMAAASIRFRRLAEWRAADAKMVRLTGHHLPRPHDLAPPSPATGATAARSVSRSSNGAPWGVRVIRPSGDFEWIRVASEADGRDVARRLAGEGRVDVLQMGRSRARNASRDDLGGLIR